MMKLTIAYTDVLATLWHFATKALVQFYHTPILFSFLKVRNVDKLIFRCRQGQKFGQNQLFFKM